MFSSPSWTALCFKYLILFVWYPSLNQVQASHFYIDELLVTCSYNFTDTTNCPSGVSSQTINVKIPRGESALYVLEKAANTNRAFNFSVNFDGFGYTIQKVSTVETTNDCKWLFFVESSLFTKFSPEVDIGDYIIPFTTYDDVSFKFPIKVELLYQERPPSKSRDGSSKQINLLQQQVIDSNILYTVKSPDERCPQIDLDSLLVNISKEGSVLSVMEEAVRLNIRFEFDASYSDQHTGYQITSIANVANTESCSWLLYYAEPNQERYLVPIGPSNFFIPSSNGNVIFEMTYVSSDSQL